MARKFKFERRLLEHIKFGRVDEAKSMLNEDLAKTFDGAMTLLHYAVYWENEALVQHLITLGSVIDSVQAKDGNTPLILAVKSENPPIVNALLDNNANIYITNARGRNVLLMVFTRRYKNTEILKLILSKIQTEPIDTEVLVDKLLAAGCDQFRCIEYFRDIPIIRCILQRGFDVNSRDYQGRTALRIVTEYNETKLVKLLIDHNADVNIFAADGTNPLLYAAWSGFKDTLKLLLEVGANPNVTHTKYGFTAINAVLASIIWSSIEDSDECLELLFQHDVIPKNHPNSLVSFFDTALHKGKSKKYYLLINYLILLKELGRPLDDSLFNVNSDCFRPIVTESINACHKFLSTVVFANLTMLELLTDSEAKMRIHFRNGNLLAKMQQLLNSNDENKQIFPYYYSTLTKRITKALRAIELEEKAISVISNIMEENRNKCYVGARMIVAYLNEKDLEQLIQVI